MKLFCVSIDEFEERPIVTTRIFSKIDQIVIVHDEKLPKFFGNGSQVYLRRVDKIVENEFCHINRVSDDDDFWYSWKIGSLIDTTSDGKELRFSRYNINCIMNCLDNGFITDMDMSNRSGNIVLDTYVWDDKSGLPMLW